MAKIDSVYDFSDKALVELKSWLEPWFLHRPAAAATGAAGPRELIMVFDGVGTALVTGIAGEVSLDSACTITHWRLLADQVGSIVIDIWKDTYANYPPTVADTITGSALPTITSDDQADSGTLTGWTTAVSAGDTFRFNINSVTAITRVTLTLTLV